MSWRSPKYFGRIFDEMTKEFQEVEEMIGRMFRTTRSWTPETVITGGPWYYGFSVNIGPDGKPVIREFGNVRPTSKGQVEAGVRAPLAETILDDQKNEVWIVAEMPGVSKKDIKLSATEDVVTISAEHEDKKYHTEVPLSVKIDAKSADASYNNGILELKFKLKEPIKSKSVDIEVK